MEEKGSVTESKTGPGSIFRRKFSPVGKVRGPVLMLHGLGDHSGTHLGTASLLCSLGYEVHAFDWPGHGQSSGWRGDIPDVTDAFALIDEAFEEMEGLPSGIFAHSTGAFLFLRYLQWKKEEDLAAPEIPWLWLNSPLLRPGHNQSESKKKLAGWIARYAPRIPLTTGVRRSDVCHVEHPDVHSTRKDFAGCHNRVSARFGFSLLQSEESVMNSAPVLPADTRLLMIQGDEDQICPPAFAFEFFGKAKCHSKTLVYVKGARHEIFRESVRASFFAAARCWFVDM